VLIMLTGHAYSSGFTKHVPMNILGFASSDFTMPREFLSVIACTMVSLRFLTAFSGVDVALKSRRRFVASSFRDRSLLFREEIYPEYSFVIDRKIISYHHTLCGVSFVLPKGWLLEFFRECIFCDSLLHLTLFVRLTFLYRLSNFDECECRARECQKKLVFPFLVSFIRSVTRFRPVFARGFVTCVT